MFNSSKECDCVYHIFKGIVYRKIIYGRQEKAIRKIIQEPLGKSCGCEETWEYRQRNCLLLLLSLVLRAVEDCFLKINRLLSNGNNLQDLEYYQLSRVMG